MIRLIPLLVLMLAVAVACSNDQPIEAGGGGGGDDVLDAVIEPTNAIVDDFGDGWIEVDRWFTEGAITEWISDCDAFDDLAAIFDDLPTTVVWQADNADLVQRVTSLDWDAAAYVELLRTVPTTCPTVTMDATTLDIAPAAVDADLNGADQAAIELSAYPIPSRETDISNPEFLEGRPTWLVVAARHNVVSLLIYSPTDGSGVEGLADVAARMAQALTDAPIEASGPIVRPSPPPAVARQVIDDVELHFDSTTCRNDGGFTHDGIDWRLSGPVPYRWRHLSPAIGQVTMEGITATFVSPDGTSLVLTTGAVQTDCPTWEQEPPQPAPTRLGRLDCSDSALRETRVPDDGQDPAAIAADADAGVVAVEAGEPLHWWGVDDAGTVIVAVLLGDAVGADYQVFTCE